MNNAPPLVSVIVNCYNGEEYLKDSLDSVLNQTYQNWELIFWDNRSTDSSAVIFQSYKDSRFKYFLAENHTVLYEARNYAIEKSSGELIAFLDTDDWWNSLKLELQIPLFSNSEVGLVYGNYWFLDEQRKKRRMGEKYPLRNGWMLDELLRNSSVGLLTTLVRRSALNSLGDGCDPRYHIIGDFDLYIRLSMKWKFACVEETIATYRWHGDNETQRRPDLEVHEWELWLSEAVLDPIISERNSFKIRVASIFALQASYLYGQRRYRQVGKLLWKPMVKVNRLRLVSMLIRHVLVGCRQRLRTYRKKDSRFR